MNFPTQFERATDLSLLPWFELRDGRVCAIDGAYGPVVDAHTHLALTFLRRRSVDLMADHGPCQHYLPMDRPLNLDVYQNLNFEPPTMRAMRSDLGLKSVTKGGMRKTHTAPALLSEMDELGINASVLLPIDFPVLSWNADAYLEVASCCERLPSLASVHSHRRKAIEVLAEQKSRGAKGIKVHPGVQLVRPDHPKCMALYRAAGELEMPVMWHCGPVDIETALGRGASQLKHYVGAVRDNPETTFVLGHSGALQWKQGLEIAQNYPNAWLEFSSQSLPVLRELIAKGPRERMLFGSDWPFYHQATALAKVLIATEDDHPHRAAILSENVMRLYNLDPALVEGN